MVTNQNYIQSIKEISSLFCSNKPIGEIPLCRSNIESRLNLYFDDSNFNIFLANLNSKRFFVFNGIKSISGIRGHFTVTIKTEDIVTGGYKEFTVQNLDLPSPILAIKKIGSVVPSNDSIMFYKLASPNYGITYQPSKVPSGGGGSGGGGSVIPTPIVPEPTVPVEMAGIDFDIQSLFSNPLVWLGVGVAVYYGMIKRK